MTATEFRTAILPAYGAMTAVAQRLLGDAESAADVVQDVMRTLWEGHVKLDIKAGASYAVRAVRNRCLDVLRRRPAVSQVPVEAVADTMADDVDDTEARRIEKLVGEIENLGEPRRTILKLSMSGQSSAQIAATVRLSEANVRQHLSRARKQLRELILKNQ